MGILLALLPILSGLLSGGSAASVFGALSLSDWIGLAGSLVDAEPSVVAAIRALHPAFDLLIGDLKLHGPLAAGTNAWKRRQPKYIPNYLHDGSLGDVLNPDYLAS
jgi:hypothetical protein